MKKHIANTITGCRILGSIILLFFPAFSVSFYTLYLFCGLSDMADGFAARKTNSISEFGMRLDTAADILFTAVSLIKFLPAIHIPKWLWIWIAVIAVMKISTILRGFLYRKKLVSLHTMMNKTTGVFLFLLPLTFHFAAFKYISIAVCSLATFSAMQEGYYLRTGREIA